MTDIAPRPRLNLFFRIVLISVLGLFALLAAYGVSELSPPQSTEVLPSCVVHDVLAASRGSSVLDTSCGSFTNNAPEAFTPGQSYSLTIAHRWTSSRVTSAVLEGR